MQIVIEIDEETYKDIKRGKIYTSYRDVPQESVLAIANGTPLTKGHGRLIDADKLWNAYHDLDYDFYEAFDLVDTIIEADTESEDKE